MKPGGGEGGGGIISETVSLLLQNSSISICVVKACATSMAGEFCSLALRHIWAYFDALSPSMLRGDMRWQRRRKISAIELRVCGIKKGIFII